MKQTFDIRVKELPRNSEHHIIPRSRTKHLKHNKVKINRKLHEYYHSLFENRLPTEIVTFLNTYFWGNKYVIKITSK